jgi:sulfite exporter TauE/SafE
MISTSDAIAAMTIGLMGSAHCAAMCGGIAGALTLGIDDNRQHRLPIIAGFHIGRILSYALIGALLGGVMVALAGEIKPLSVALRLLAGLLLIAMGLYVANWWTGLTSLERIGVPVWSRLQPLTNKLLPVKTTGGALALGGLWGWLPCGLVYSALSWAVTAGSTLEAASRMLLFGIGTLPAMVTMSVAADTSRRLLQQQNTRRVAGILLIAFGLWTLVTPLQMLAGGHKMDAHSQHDQHQHH